MKSGDARNPAEGIWLLASFASLAASGLLLNLLIAFRYGAEVLGLFNLAYAVYIFAAQLAVIGQQYAALYHVSVHSGKERGRHAAASSLLCGLAFSLVVIALLFLTRAPLAALMSTPELETAILCMLPGLFFFSGDKILLAVLNAQNKVAAYARGAMLRYASMLAGVSLFALFQTPGEYLPATFSLAESCVFLRLLRVAGPYLALPQARGELAALVRGSFSYGARGFAAGLLAELNSRVDILVLGMFVPMAQVGAYSFVALIAEGIGQLPLLGRMYIDPILARLWARKDTGELMRLVRRSRLLAWLVMSGICMAAFFAVHFFTLFLPGGSAYRETMLPFAVLLSGIAVSSGYAPLSGILQQSGHPGLQSGQIAASFLANLVFSLLLVPLWGILGAAVALVISQIGGMFVLRGMAKRRLKLPI